MARIFARASALVCGQAFVLLASAQTFVNFETPQFHPLELSLDGAHLLALNSADARLERFAIRSPNGYLQPAGSVFVGIDPTSVRVRTASEAWVVNQISDSISIVDLTTLRVRRTLETEDEPCDVVFAGTPERAFVSCAQPSKLMVFDPADLDSARLVLAISAEEPRALATNPERTKVYLAVFESGNRSTILGAAGAVNNGAANPTLTQGGPYNRQSPPPNHGNEFYPPMNPELSAFRAPPSNLIVQKDVATGRWMDDNNTDWTFYVSGNANSARRVPGWDMLDHDVAVIDANTLAISYLTDMMQACAALAVQPASGKVSVVGTEATNVIRFEPNLKGRFVRVHLALGDEAAPAAPRVVDLNPHLDYSDEQIAEQSNPETASETLRDLSLGDPRAIVWSADGGRGYVAGMGSNNVIVIDADGNRVADPIEVAEGPTGLALHESLGRLYVLSRFAAKISIIDTNDNSVLAERAFFDPTPAAIRVGRKHLYDTHKSSALGQVSCASCHPDARSDRLGWDLGNPAGSMHPMNQSCRAGVVVSNEVRDCPDFHPLKGPMVTQTLQDIIGKEPFHWRGDKNGIEDFNVTFTDLLGDDAQLSPQEMQEFKDFLATLHFPPNPFRNFDNSLSVNVAIPHQFLTGGFPGARLGDPLPNGNAVQGLTLFRTQPAHSSNGVLNRTCVSCHTLPTGIGTGEAFVGDSRLFPDPGSGHYEPLPPGPNGEHFHSVVGLPLNFDNLPLTVKIVQMRDLHRKLGFAREVSLSRSGFGVFHSGTESLAGFISEFVKFPDTVEQLADIVAFLISLSGSELPLGSSDALREPPGPLSQDAHAAVGKQITFHGTNGLEDAAIARLNEMVALADAGKVGLIAKGPALASGGWIYASGVGMRGDHAADVIDVGALRLSAVGGAEITFTVVPKGSETRLGIDRNLDGILDADEAPEPDCNGNSFADESDIAVGASADCDGDGIPDECQASEPRFEQQPVAATACEGASATFAAAASGAAPLAYQWRKDSTPISGANEASLTLVGVTAADAGSYDVVATNSCGSSTSESAALVVQPGAVVDAGADRSGCGDAVLTLSGAATAAATVGWTTSGDGTFEDAASLVARYTPGAGDAAAGAVTLTLSAESISPCAGVVRDSLIVTLDAPPAILGQSGDAEVFVGQPASFEVSAGGTEPLAYQWRKDGGDLTDSDRRGGTATPTLSLAAVEAADAGYYDCVVSGPCGSIASTPAELRVVSAGCADAQHACAQADIFPADAPDCFVDLGDLGVLLANYDGGPGKTRAQGDIFPADGGDGNVDLGDLGVMLSVYGADCR